MFCPSSNYKVCSICVQCLQYGHQFDRCLSLSVGIVLTVRYRYGLVFSSALNKDFDHRRKKRTIIIMKWIPLNKLDKLHHYILVIQRMFYRVIYIRQLWWCHYYRQIAIFCMVNNAEINFTTTFWNVVIITINWKKNI